MQGYKYYPNENLEFIHLPYIHKLKAKFCFGKNKNFKNPSIKLFRERDQERLGP